MNSMARRIAADRSRPLHVRLRALRIEIEGRGGSVTAVDRYKGGYRLHGVTADGRPFTLELDPGEG